MRYSLVYGYGKSLTLKRGTIGDVLTELIDKPTRGETGVISAGDAILDLIHVEDAARATVLASQSENIRSSGLTVVGQRVALKDAAALMRTILPEAKIEVHEGSWNGTDYDLDGKTTFAEIGYAPILSLEDGLRQNVAELRKHGG